MIKHNTIYDILIVEDNALALPVNVVETIEDASEWIGCSTQALYDNMALYGVMKAKGYVLELVPRERGEV